MRNKSTQVVLGLGVVMALLISACGGAAPTVAPPEAEAPTEAPTTAPTEAPADTQEPTSPPPTDAPADEPAAEADVAVAQTGMGTVLVNAEGLTLYAFTQDSADASACSGGCADFWPPLTIEGEPVAGEGVDGSLLSTLTRADGSLQLTYNGLPLYTYSEDAAPGDTNGQGVNGAWFVVNPAGEMVQEAQSSGSGDGSDDDGLPEY